MQIFITYTYFYNNKHDYTVTINVDSFDTVERLKELYAIKVGFENIFALRFAYKGRILHDDERTLHDYGILPNSTIHHVERLRGD